MQQQAHRAVQGWARSCTAFGPMYTEMVKAQNEVQGNPHKTAQLRAAYNIDVLWPLRYTIKIAFMDGSPEDQALVQQLIKEAYFNPDDLELGLTLDFTASQDVADVRISFNQDTTTGGGGSWCALGAQALSAQFKGGTGTTVQLQPTMNFGWDIQTDHGTVLHEFGHLFGLIHEHQQPKARLPFDKEGAYAFFGGPPNNWSRQMVDDQVLDVVNSESINGTAFDRDSIMLYSFDCRCFINCGRDNPEVRCFCMASDAAVPQQPTALQAPPPCMQACHFTSPIPLRRNVVLSPMDKQLLRQMYPLRGPRQVPGPEGGGPRPGTGETGATGGTGNGTTDKNGQTGKKGDDGNTQTEDDTGDFISTTTFSIVVAVLGVIAFVFLIAFAVVMSRAKHRPELAQPSK